MTFVSYRKKGLHDYKKKERTSNLQAISFLLSKLWGTVQRYGTEPSLNIHLYAP